MLYKIDDEKEFKQRNLQNWLDISAFWLEGRMQHIPDISPKVATLVRELLSSECSSKRGKVVDVGCGDGWFFRLLEAEGLLTEYVGIDFNPKFVEELQARHGANKHAHFIVGELDGVEMPALACQADLVVSFFNLFEIPRIEVAFRNAASLLGENGRLLIGTIDPVLQILSVSDGDDDFRANLKIYEQFGENLGYDKDADVGAKPSGRIYRGILHSIATYARLAGSSGLCVERLDEVIKTGNRVPQIYHLLLLRRVERGA